MIYKDPITIERDTLLDMIHMLQLMATMLGESFVMPGKLEEQTDRLKYLNKIIKSCNQSQKEQEND